jgi:hypothetical protein
MNNNDYTESEIQRSQRWLELVLGPEEIALLAEEALDRKPTLAQEQDIERNQ